MPEPARTVKVASIVTAFICFLMVSPVVYGQQVVTTADGQTIVVSPGQEAAVSTSLEVAGDSVPTVGGPAGGRRPIG